MNCQGGYLQYYFYLPLSAPQRTDGMATECVGEFSDPVSPDFLVMNLETKTA